MVSYFPNATNYIILSLKMLKKITSRAWCDDNMKVDNQILEKSILIEECHRSFPRNRIKSLQITHWRAGVDYEYGQLIDSGRELTALMMW